MIRVISILVSCWLLTAVGRAQPVVVLTDPVESRTIWREAGAEYYEDGSRFMPLAEVRRRPFRPTATHSESFGLTNHSIWVRFRVRNNTPPPTTYVVGSTFGLIDTVGFYLIDEATGRIVQRQSGRLVPHTLQPIDTDDRVFPLDVLPQRTYTVYFRAAGRSAKRMRFFILETNQYHARYQQVTWLWAGYFGFYAAIMLVQVVFFALTRNRNSLYYLLYLAAFLLVELCRGNGLVGDRYLWPNATWFKSYSLLIAVPLSTLLGMWFYANGLRLRRIRRIGMRLYWAFWVVAGLILALAGLSLVSAAHINVVRQMMLLPLPANALVLIGSAYAWRRGYEPARFYLMATLCFLAGIVVTLVWQMGLLPNYFWIMHAINIGCMLEMLFFTVALADEYRLSHRERLQTQTELIEVLQNRNAEISSALLQGQTLERQRVAADLHDNLGATLSSLRWTVHSIKKSGLSGAEQTVLTQIDEQLTRAHADVRLLSHNLLPTELAAEGLPAALQSLTDKLTNHTHTSFTLALPDPPPRFAPQVEFELYSICLELTNNILKHAHATEALIRLRLQPGTIQLTISDDGVGLGEAGGRGNGLQNVAARVTALGGEWFTDSEVGQGVVHRIVVPMKAA